MPRSPSPLRSLPGRLVLLALGLLASAPRAEPVSEALVKAGFIYNFAKFTDWPAGSLPSAAALQLCLVGPDPQGTLAAAFDGKAVQGRSLLVRRVQRLEELRGCQIVYLGDVDERRQTEVLRLLRGQPVLSIGDGEGFAELGGTIGLVLVGDRLQFEVNVETAQAAGLKISSQLLRLARALRGRP